jgi:hypothetical protein
LTQFSSNIISQSKLSPSILPHSVLGELKHNLTSYQLRKDVSLSSKGMQMVFIFRLLDELIWFPRSIPPQMDWGKMRNTARNIMKKKNVCQCTWNCRRQMANCLME